MRSLDPFDDLVQTFRPAFTKPTFTRFAQLLLAWIATAGRRTITRMIQCPVARSRSGKPAHHAAFHRFFTRAKWSPDALGRLLLQKLLLPALGDAVTLIVDDTLCRRTGPRILGVGMHHDPLRSSRSSGGKAAIFTSMALGLNLVVLGVWVPVAFMKSGGLCVPFLVRLYRSKRTCPEARYRKRTVLAVELLELARPWLGDRRVTVVADREYACQTVLRALPPGTGMAGTLPMAAVLHDPRVVQSGRGRRRLWGDRLPTPAALANDRRQPWRATKVTLYGKPVTVMVKTIRATWLRGGPGRHLRVVVTRDPNGRWRDGALFSTRPADTPAAVLEAFARRWTVETAFRDAKQCMGLESTQNGWTRRRRQPRRRQEGPHADRRRSPIGSWRTAYFCLLAYGVTVAWYLRHGQPDADVSRVRDRSPWYSHKRTVSFNDMWRALNRSIWTQTITNTQQPPDDFETPSNEVTDWLLAS